MKNSTKKALQIVFGYVMMFLLWTAVLIGASDSFSGF